MRKIVMLVCLAAIIILSGCGAAVSNTPSESAAVVTASASAAMPSSDAHPSASEGLIIPSETKVYAAEGELAGVKPLFESYLSGNDMLAFAVSAVFNGDAYIMGFVYENNEGILPFSRVIGLKQNGTSIEEAFISDNYKNPEGLEPVNFIQFQDNQFYDTQAFVTGGVLIVKTNEYLSEDAEFHNFFLLNEQGLLDNHINTNLNEPCELYEHQDKLLLNENYTWYEFNVKDRKIALTEINDFKPYQPDISNSDFVITLKDFKPGTYDESTYVYNDNSYINVNINSSEVLTKDNFKKEWEESGYCYLSKKSFTINSGERIIFLYPPGIKVNCFIRGETDDTGFERSSLPGAEILKAREPGGYVVQIENGDVYQIYLTAK